MRRQLRTVLLVTPPYHCGMVESAGVWMPMQPHTHSYLLRVARLLREESYLAREAAGAVHEMPLGVGSA